MQHQIPTKTSEGQPVKILDVGCGNNKAQGAVGLDISPNSAADIIHDLETFPYPFQDNEFDLIICNHIIEHLGDTRRFLGELHRIAKPNGLIKGVTPHFSNPCSFADPTHKHHFSYHFLNFFIEAPRKPLGRFMRRLNDYLWFDTFGTESFSVDFRFELVHSELTFPPIFRKLGIAALANRHPDLYEFYLCGMFRGRDLYFVLKALKPEAPER